MFYHQHTIYGDNFYNFQLSKQPQAIPYFESRERKGGEKGLKIMTKVMWLYCRIRRLEYVNLSKWLCFCVNIWVNRRNPLVQLQITMSKYEKWSFFIRYRHFVPVVDSLGAGDRSLKPDPVFWEYETEIKILIILITDMSCLTARAVGETDLTWCNKTSLQMTDRLKSFVIQNIRFWS